MKTKFEKSLRWLGLACIIAWLIGVLCVCYGCATTQLATGPVSRQYVQGQIEATGAKAIILEQKEYILPTEQEFWEAFSGADVNRQHVPGYNDCRHISDNILARIKTAHPEWPCGTSHYRKHRTVCCLTQSGLVQFNFWDNWPYRVDPDMVILWTPKYQPKEYIYPAWYRDYRDVGGLWK